MFKITPNETLAQRQQLLAVAGMELVFPSFTILGVNGEEIQVEVLNTGMQNLHAVDYYFQVLEEDVRFYSITARDQFKVQTAESELLFEISHVRKDMYSWVRLDAILRSESLLAAPVVPYNPVNLFLSPTPITGVYRV
jgi:hypothetical protein